MSRAIMSHIANGYAKVRAWDGHDREESHARGWAMKNIHGVVMLYHYGTLIAADFGDRIMCTATSASDRNAVNSLCWIAHGHPALSIAGGFPNDGGNPKDDVAIFAGPRPLKDAVRNEMERTGVCTPLFRAARTPVSRHTESNRNLYILKRITPLCRYGGCTTCTERKRQHGSR